MLRIIYVALIALCAQQALIRSATAAEQGSLAGQPTGTLGLTPLGLAFSVLPPAERKALGVSFEVCPTTSNTRLLPPNHYLAVAIDYLFRHRPQWRELAAVGKTVAGSQMIDRVTAKLGRKLYEVPVGFKWFVDGLLEGTLGFGGEQSAGASFLRRDGTVWTTDKDGIVPALLSAEITARIGRDPGENYRSLTREHGEPAFDRIDAPAMREQKQLLAKLSPQQVRSAELAGDKIQTMLSHAPGNGAPIGGLKVIAENGWFAERPSGTKNIYKLYAESFCGPGHLHRISEDAQAILDNALDESVPGAFTPGSAP